MAEVGSARIPKLINKEGIKKVDIQNRDVQNLLADVNKKCLDINFHKEFTVLEVFMLHNSELQADYVKKRAEMKDEGRNGQALIEQLGFLNVLSDQRSKLAKQGLVTRYLPFNRLGKSKFGVYFNRYFDVEVKHATANSNSSDVQEIAVLKYFAGKCKSLNIGNVYSKHLDVEPTPNYDSHISSAAPLLNESTFVQKAKAEIYLYEYDEQCEPRRRPRHCLPYAILKIKRKPPPEKINSAPTPSVPQATSTQSLSTHSSTPVTSSNGEIASVSSSQPTHLQSSTHAPLHISNQSSSTSMKNGKLDTNKDKTRKVTDKDRRPKKSATLNEEQEKQKEQMRNLYLQRLTLAKATVQAEQSKELESSQVLPTIPSHLTGAQPVHTALRKDKSTSDGAVNKGQWAVESVPRIQLDDPNLALSSSDDPRIQTANKLVHRTITETQPCLPLNTPSANMVPSTENLCPSKRVDPRLDRSLSNSGAAKNKVSVDPRLAKLPLDDKKPLPSGPPHKPHKPLAAPTSQFPYPMPAKSSLKSASTAKGELRKKLSYSEYKKLKQESLTKNALPSEKDQSALSVANCQDNSSTNPTSEVPLNGQGKDSKNKKVKELPMPITFLDVSKLPPKASVSDKPTQSKDNEVVPLPSFYQEYTPDDEPPCPDVDFNQFQSPVLEVKKNKTSPNKSSASNNTLLPLPVIKADGSVSNVLRGVVDGSMKEIEVPSPPTTAASRTENAAKKLLINSELVRSMAKNLLKNVANISETLLSVSGGDQPNSASGAINKETPSSAESLVDKKSVKVLLRGFQKGLSGKLGNMPQQRESSDVAQSEGNDGEVSEPALSEENESAKPVKVKCKENLPVGEGQAVEAEQNNNSTKMLKDPLTCQNIEKWEPHVKLDIRSAPPLPLIPFLVSNHNTAEEDNTASEQQEKNETVEVDTSPHHSNALDENEMAVSAPPPTSPFQLPNGRNFLSTGIWLAPGESMPVTAMTHPTSSTPSVASLELERVGEEMVESTPVHMEKPKMDIIEDCSKTDFCVGNNGTLVHPSVSSPENDKENSEPPNIKGQAQSTSAIKPKTALPNTLVEASLAINLPVSGSNASALCTTNSSESENAVSRSHVKEHHLQTYTTTTSTDCNVNFSAEDMSFGSQASCKSMPDTTGYFLSGGAPQANLKSNGLLSEDRELSTVPKTKCLTLKELGFVNILQAMSDLTFQPSTLLVDVNKAVTEKYPLDSCQTCRKLLSPGSQETACSFFCDDNHSEASESSESLALLSTDAVSEEEKALTLGSISNGSAIFDELPLKSNAQVDGSLSKGHEPSTIVSQALASDVDNLSSSMASDKVSSLSPSQARTPEAIDTQSCHATPWDGNTYVDCVRKLSALQPEDEQSASIPRDKSPHSVDAAVKARLGENAQREDKAWDSWKQKEQRKDILMKVLEQKKKYLEREETRKKVEEHLQLTKITKETIKDQNSKMVLETKEGKDLTEGSQSKENGKEKSRDSSQEEEKNDRQQTDKNQTSRRIKKNEDKKENRVHSEIKDKIEESSRKSNDNHSKERHRNEMRQKPKERTETPERKQRERRRDRSREGRRHREHRRDKDKEYERRRWGRVDKDREGLKYREKAKESRRDSLKRPNKKDDYKQEMTRRRITDLVSRDNWTDGYKRENHVREEREEKVNKASHQLEHTMSSGEKTRNDAPLETVFSKESKKKETHIYQVGESNFKAGNLTEQEKLPCDKANIIALNESGEDFDLEKTESSTTISSEYGSSQNESDAAKNRELTSQSRKLDDLITKQRDETEKESESDSDEIGLPKNIIQPGKKKIFIKLSCTTQNEAAKVQLVKNCDLTNSTSTISTCSAVSGSATTKDQKVSNLKVWEAATSTSDIPRVSPAAHPVTTRELLVSHENNSESLIPPCTRKAGSAMTKEQIFSPINVPEITSADPDSETGGTAVSSGISPDSSQETAYASDIAVALVLASDETCSDVAKIPLPAGTGQPLWIDVPKAHTVAEEACDELYSPSSPTSEDKRDTAFTFVDSSHSETHPMKHDQFLGDVSHSKQEVSSTSEMVQGLRSRRMSGDRNLFSLYPATDVQSSGPDSNEFGDVDYRHAPRASHRPSLWENCFDPYLNESYMKKQGEASYYNDAPIKTMPPLYNDAYYQYHETYPPFNDSKPCQSRQPDQWLNAEARNEDMYGYGDKDYRQGLCSSLPYSSTSQYSSVAEAHMHHVDMPSQFECYATSGDNFSSDMSEWKRNQSAPTTRNSGQCSPNPNFAMNNHCYVEYWTETNEDNASSSKQSPLQSPMQQESNHSPCCDSKPSEGLQTHTLKEGPPSEAAATIQKILPEMFSPDTHQQRCKNILKAFTKSKSSTVSKTGLPVNNNNEDESESDNDEVGVPRQIKKDVQVKIPINLSHHQQCGTASEEEIKQLSSVDNLKQILALVKKNASGVSRGYKNEMLQNSPTAETFKLDTLSEKNTVPFDESGAACEKVSSMENLVHLEDHRSLPRQEEAVKQTCGWPSSSVKAVTKHILTDIHHIDALVKNLTSVEELKKIVGHLTDKIHATVTEADSKDNTNLVKPNIIDAKAQQGGVPSITLHPKKSPSPILNICSSGTTSGGEEFDKQISEALDQADHNEAFCQKESSPQNIHDTSVSSSMLKSQGNNTKCESKSCDEEAHNEQKMASERFVAGEDHVQSEDEDTLHVQQCTGGREHYKIVESSKKKGEVCNEEVPISLAADSSWDKDSVRQVREDDDGSLKVQLSSSTDTANVVTVDNMSSNDELKLKSKPSKSRLNCISESSYSSATQGCFVQDQLKDEASSHKHKNGIVSYQSKLSTSKAVVGGLDGSEASGRISPNSNAYHNDISDSRVVVIDSPTPVSPFPVEAQPDESRNTSISARSDGKVYLADVPMDVLSFARAKILQEINQLSHSEEKPTSGRPEELGRVGDGLDNDVDQSTEDGEIREIDEVDERGSLSDDKVCRDDMIINISDADEEEALICGYDTPTSSEKTRRRSFKNENKRSHRAQGARSREEVISVSSDEGSNPEKLKTRKKTVRGVFCKKDSHGLRLSPTLIQSCKKKLNKKKSRKKQHCDAALDNSKEEVKFSDISETESSNDDADSLLDYANSSPCKAKVQNVSKCSPLDRENALDRNTSSKIDEKMAEEIADEKRPVGQRLIKTIASDLKSKDEDKSSKCTSVRSYILETEKHKKRPTKLKDKSKSSLFSDTSEKIELLLKNRCFESSHCSVSPKKMTTTSISFELSQNMPEKKSCSPQERGKGKKLSSLIVGKCVPKNKVQSPVSEKSSVSQVPPVSREGDNPKLMHQQSGSRCGTSMTSSPNKRSRSRSTSLVSEKSPMLEGSRTSNKHEHVSHRKAVSRSQSRRSRSTSPLSEKSDSSELSRTKRIRSPRSSVSRCQRDRSSRSTSRSRVSGKRRSRLGSSSSARHGSYRGVSASSTRTWSRSPSPVERGRYKKYRSHASPAYTRRRRSSDRSPSSNSDYSRKRRRSLSRSASPQRSVTPKRQIFCRKSSNERSPPPRKIVNNELDYYTSRQMCRGKSPVWKDLPSYSFNGPVKTLTVERPNRKSVDDMDLDDFTSRKRDEVSRPLLNNADDRRVVQLVSPVMKQFDFCELIQEHKIERERQLNPCNVTIQQLIITHFGTVIPEEMKNVFPFAFDQSFTHDTQGHLWPEKVRYDFGKRVVEMFGSAMGIPQKPISKSSINLSSKCFDDEPCRKRFEEFSNHQILLEVNVIKQCQALLHAQGTSTPKHFQGEIMLQKKTVEQAELQAKILLMKEGPVSSDSSQALAETEMKLAAVQEECRHLMQACVEHNRRKAGDGDKPGGNSMSPTSTSSSLPAPDIPEALRVSTAEFEFHMPTQLARGHGQKCGFEDVLDKVAGDLIELYKCPDFGRVHFRVPDLLLLDSEKRSHYSVCGLPLVLISPIHRECFHHLLVLREKLESLAPELRDSSVGERLVAERSQILTKFVDKVKRHRVTQLKSSLRQFDQCGDFLKDILGSEGLEKMEIFDTFQQALWWHYKFLERESRV